MLLNYGKNYRPDADSKGLVYIIKICTYIPAQTRNEANTIEDRPQIFTLYHENVVHMTVGKMLEPSSYIPNQNIMYSSFADAILHNLQNSNFTYFIGVSFNWL